MVPYYSLSKFKVREYTSERDPAEIYDRDAFNAYGDNCKHWTRTGQNVAALKPLDIKSFDQFAIDLLADFETALKQKGARLLVTFPALQEESFLSQRNGIKKVETEMKKVGFWLDRQNDTLYQTVYYLTVHTI